MAHKVSLNLPGIEVGNTNATFIIQKDRKQIGKISISRGGIEYFTGRKQSPIEIDWTIFDKLMKDYNDKK